MPTYEYECRKCGHRFEEFQSMKDAALTVCPKCGGELKRLIGTGAGFLFKGSGFYITDYRSPGYSEKKKGESGDKPAEKTEGKKPEAKPEAKPEKKPKESP